MHSATISVFYAGLFFKEPARINFTPQMYSRHIGLRICCKKAGAGAFLCHLDLCTVGLRFGHANLRLVLAGLCCKHPEGF